MIVSLKQLKRFASTAINSSLDELQDEYYEVLTSEYLRIEGTKPSGFFFHSWIMPGSKVKDRPAEDVLRNFFNSI